MSPYLNAEDNSNNVSISGNYKKMGTYWKFEPLVSNDRKMTALSIFASNCQKLILFRRYFSTSQIQAIFFLNVHNIRKKQWSSVKFRLKKYWLYDKQPVEHAILSFSVFSFLQHWHVFCQNDKFSKFYYVKNLYDLETFHIHLKKSPFCCLLFLNSGNI